MPELAKGQRRISRLAAFFLMIFAILYGYLGGTVEYSFSSDPIGPRGFPVALAIVLFGLSVWYFAQPGQSESWPDRDGQIAAITLLALCSACILGMNFLGFLPAMTIILGGIARLFGASWPMAALSGLAQAAIWWALFGPLLGGHLPKGLLGI
ncbi:MAG: tripartite tricarboxylate transporter TctB family protein [Rhizobiales bacterium]|nr:tripartite tricarboxylate transporter TctB family protein [Hyphomicrobiales bacterium]